MGLSTIPNIELDLSQFKPEAHDILREFLRITNTHLKLINQEIDAYNHPDNRSKKSAILASIKEKIKTMDDLQSGQCVAHCPDYSTKIHTKLFRELQEEHHLIDIEANKPANTSAPTLAELIAHMDPEKINQMTSILANSTDNNFQTALKNLYQPGENGKEAYDAFLKHHHIRKFSVGNSTNFKVSNIDTKQAQVLKIENRLGLPKQPETQLRNTAASGALTSLYADRHAVYKDTKTNRWVSRNLQVTEFCPGSDLENYANNLPTDELELILINAASIHIKMTEILEQFQAVGCAFPDMKNTNWLMNSSSQLKIADGKSFVVTDSSGNITPETRIIRTERMSAPEMLGNPRLPFSADKMHAYILGKNLYLALTGDDDTAFSYKDSSGKNNLRLDASTFDFSAPIFKTKKGQKFEKLIRATVKFKPDDRLSLAETQAEMKAIAPQYQQADQQSKAIVSNLCSNELNEMKKLCMRPKDTKLNDFLDANAKFLQTNPSLQTLLELRKSLENTLKNNLLAGSLFSEAHEQIKSLRDTSMTAEANRLEKLLDSTPFEQRVALFQSNTPEAKELDQIKETIHTKKNIKLLLKEIETFKIATRGVEDSQMTLFIDAIKAKLNTAKTTEALTEINLEVQSTLTALQKSKPVVAKINSLSEQNKFGMEVKGRRIAEALVQVPLKEREHILKGATSTTENVLKETASSRYLPRFMHSVRETPEGRLDPKKASTMFKELQNSPEFNEYEKFQASQQSPTNTSPEEKTSEQKQKTNNKQQRQ